MQRDNDPSRWRRDRGVLARVPGDGRHVAARQRGRAGPGMVAIRTREIVLCSDLSVDDRWPGWSAQACGQGVRGVLSVPVDINDQVIGALNLYVAEPARFTPEVQFVAVLVAEHAGLLIAAVLDRTRKASRANELSTAMIEGETVNRAIGIVMAQRSCAAEDALEVLRQAATTVRQPLLVVAGRLVSTIANRSTPGTTPPSRLHDHQNKRMAPTSTIMAALAVVVCTACSQPSPATPSPPLSSPPLSSPPPALTPAPLALSPTGRPLESLGWIVTVYYTAVERFHTDQATRVSGCPRLNCTSGNTNLGSYPKSFAQAVHDEGTGRTASGRYLNWSSDVGYWLDEAPRDSSGGTLLPFQSAAADGDVMRPGTRFTITGCGRDDDGSAIPADVCALLRNGQWSISDEFTPGLGGSHHLDVYIGEEDRPHFTDSPWYATLNGATLTYA